MNTNSKKNNVKKFDNTATSIPIEWHIVFKKTSFNTYQFRATAIIKQPWRLYSIKSPQEGTLPTTIEFKKGTLLYPLGDLKEVGNKIKHFDSQQNKNTSYYLNQVAYIQNFQVFIKPEEIIGKIYYTPYTKEYCLPTIAKDFQVIP